MSDDGVRQILAFIAGCFGVMAILLLGVVDVKDPTMAKIVGAVMGFVSAKVDIILRRYFDAEKTR